MGTVKDHFQLAALFGVAFLVGYSCVLAKAGATGTPAPAPFGSPLYGERIVNTGPYDCDGAQHTAEWVNLTGRTLRVKKASVWTGVVRKGKADVAAALVREDGSVLVDFGWDHYVDPSGPHTMIQDFAPDWIEVASGERIRLVYFCDDFGKKVKAHHVSVVWYEE